MNPYRTYQQQQQQPTGWTRIDMLLALYDGAIDRLRQASAMLKVNDREKATPLIARSQLIVSELAAGVRVDVNEEMGTNMLRLYEFVIYQLSQGQVKNLEDAIKILRTLREGFETIRGEAVQMERTGQLAAADNLKTLSATA
jgi:flagellar secretion chaperone FliS